MLTVGSLLAYANRPIEVPNQYLHKVVECQGEVISNTELDQGSRLVLKIQTLDGNEVAPAMLAARYYANIISILPGSTVRCKGEISYIPTDPVIPYDSYHPQWLRKNGIFYSMKCNIGTLEELAQPQGWRKIVNDVRRTMFRGIANAPISGKYASFLIAAILGDTTFILPVSHEAFRTTGTAHVLALSGLHVGILASLLAFVFLPFRALRRGFMFSYPLTLILIWCYAFATGLAPSVVRAAVMLSIFLICSLMQRPVNSFNSLCVALIIILTFSPLSLFIPGFQLSFAAVASILICINAVPARLQRRPILYFCVITTLVPVAAMIGTGLLSAYHFHSFPPYFLLSNITVGMLIPWVLGCGFVLMFATMMGIKLILLGQLATLLFTLMQGAIDWLGSLSNSIAVSYFSAWAFVPYFFAIAFLALMINRIRNSQHWHLPLALCIVCLFATGMMACGIEEKIPEHELYITDGTAAALIIQNQGTPYLIPLSQQGYETTSERLQEYRDRHCKGSEFLEMPCDSILGPFFYSRNCLMFGSRKLAIINAAHLNQSAPLRNVDYAIISNRFLGHISDVIAHVQPDTILLAGSIAPSRERRFIRECGDSVPYLSLRHQVFNLNF